MKKTRRTYDRRIRSLPGIFTAILSLLCISAEATIPCEEIQQYRIEELVSLEMPVEEAVEILRENEFEVGGEKTAEGVTRVFFRHPSDQEIRFDLVIKEGRLQAVTFASGLQDRARAELIEGFLSRFGGGEISERGPATRILWGQSCSNAGLQAVIRERDGASQFRLGVVRKTTGSSLPEVAYWVETSEHGVLTPDEKDPRVIDVIDVDLHFNGEGVHGKVDRITYDLVLKSGASKRMDELLGSVRVTRNECHHGQPEPVTPELGEPRWSEDHHTLTQPVTLRLDGDVCPDHDDIIFDTQLELLVSATGVAESSKTDGIQITVSNPLAWAGENSAEMKEYK